MKHFFKLLHAEKLKLKSTHLVKIIIVIPIFCNLLAFILIPSFFKEATFNWFNLLFLPLLISLAAALNFKYEKSIDNFKAITSIDVNFEKIFIAKIVILTTLILSSTLIYCINLMCISPNEIMQSIVASLCLFLTNIWQIPLVFILCLKFGFLSSIIFNMLIGDFLLILTSSKNFYFIIPYSYGARLLCRFAKVLPNGLSNSDNELIVSNLAIFLIILISIVLFIFLTFLGSKIFKKELIKQ